LRLGQQVPLEVSLPSVAVPVRRDSPLLERPDSPLLERLDSPLLERLDSSLLERPDSRRVKLRAERFVVAREIARPKLA